MRLRFNLCWRAALLAAALLVAYPVKAETVLHRELSQYHDIVVFENNGQRCMRFATVDNIGSQSCMYPSFPDEIVLETIKMLLGALYLKPDPQRILVIGMGGGILSRTLEKLYPEAEIDTVELDPAVVQVAEKYFGFKPGPKARVHVGDGRVFVKRALQDGKRYDIVVRDAIKGALVPEHMLTREFLTEVKQMLTPGGVFAANTSPISILYHNETATDVAVFGDFYNVQNVSRIIIAGRDGLPPLELVRKHAALLDDKVRRFGFDSSWLLPMFKPVPKWDPQTRVLTDQYAPANLLKERE